MRIGPSSRTMAIGHLPWFDFIVHGVNRPSMSILRSTPNHIPITHMYPNCRHVGIRNVYFLIVEANVRGEPIFSVMAAVGLLKSPVELGKWRM